MCTCDVCGLCLYTFKFFCIPLSYFPISFLEMMYTCDVCGKVCGNAGALVHHKKAHEIGSSYGPLKCFVCGKGYRSMQGLMYHKRNIHGSNVRSYVYVRTLAKTASRKLVKEKHVCQYCPDVHLPQAELEVHFACHHRDCFSFVFCRMCSVDVRQEVLLVHLRNHNCRGRGWKYVEEDRLVQLVSDSSPAEAMTSFLVERKSRLDFDYFGGQEYKLCALCSANVRTNSLADHLRDHNKRGDSHCISPEKFEVLLAEVLCDIITNIRNAYCIK